MAKKNENQAPAAVAPEVQEPAVEQPQSARDRYRGRYGEAYPDMNLDDEEAFYTQANANLDELEDYRNTNKQLGEAFDKTPLLAGMLVAAKNGENPFTYLAENIGPDMDIRELANDEEFGKKMGDALLKFQENTAKNAAAQQEMADNIKRSWDALKELQQEKGMSDEDAKALFEKMYGAPNENGEVADLGIFGNASIGNVSKEVWEAIMKAENYDNDIASATERARASALNDKVQNGLKNFDNEPKVPNLGGNSGGRAEKRKKNDGSLEAFREQLGV